MSDRNMYFLSKFVFILANNLEVNFIGHMEKILKRILHLDWM